MLREAVRLYARELQLERYVAAARRRGSKGIAIVEEFEQAGGCLNTGAATPGSRT